MGRFKLTITSFFLCLIFSFYSSPSAYAYVQTFEQLNWFGLATSTQDSSWGQVTLDFVGYSNIQYFNLIVNGDWVVQNMSISSAYGSGVNQTISTMFDLGISNGTDLGQIEYFSSIEESPWTSTPVSYTQGIGSVSDLDYQIGGEGGVDLGSPAPIDRGPLSTAKVGKSATLPNLDKVVNQAQGANQCAPGAISTSLKYLQKTDKISDSLPTNISDVAKVIHTDADGTPPNWPQVKKEYYSNYGIKTQFIEDLTSAGIDKLIKEIKDGQDIELDLYGHVAMVTGIRVKEDGTIELDIFDDNQKLPGASPMRTVTISNGKIDGMKFERFVVECPVPEPSTILLLGFGFLSLLGAAIKKRGWKG